MSAIPSPSQPVATGIGNAGAPVSSAEIDASCRAPLLLLFSSSAVWLLLGSVFALIATLKFHAPNLLADCPWFTYGRVHPAHLNCWIYGFGMQAGLGVLLWLSCQLGRVELKCAPAVIIGGIGWNTAMTLGILGILGGENTGYEWLEMPRFASVLLFISYAIIGVAALITFRRRRDVQFYTSQWFMLAALFWFPWIYTTANLLLVANPVRGVLQVVIDLWYIHNLTTVWFAFVGLATFFYFVPAISKRPLYSHYYAIFAFWILIVFGSWGGIPIGSPMPAWIPALSTMGSVLTIIAVFAIALNMMRTCGGDRSASASCISLKFIGFGGMAYGLATLAASIASIDRVSEVLNFTWFGPAQAQLFLYGFFALTMFGAIYYIVPRIAGREFCSAKAVSAHFYLAVLGIIIFVVALGVGGVREGMDLNTKGVAFIDVSHSTLTFLRASTTGDLLMAVANLIFALNMFGLLMKMGRTSFGSVWAEGTRTVEVIS